MLLLLLLLPRRGREAATTATCGMQCSINSSMQFRRTCSRFHCFFTAVSSAGQHCSIAARQTLCTQATAKPIVEPWSK
jgi:hypothetical protein